MKKLVIFFFLSLFWGCKSTHNKNEDLKKSDDTTFPIIKSNNENEKSVIYSEQELEFFLDSIGMLPVSEGLKEVWTYPDSLFTNRQEFSYIIKNEDFEKLKKYCLSGNIDFQFATRIFPEFKVDSLYIGLDSLPITLITFGNVKNSFKEFAIRIGTDLARESDVYFFFWQKLISQT